MSTAPLIPTFGSAEILSYLMMPGLFRPFDSSERDAYAGAPADAVIAEVTDANGIIWQVTFAIDKLDGLSLQAFAVSDDLEASMAIWTPGFGWQVG